MWPISDGQLREVLRHLPAVIYQDSHEPHPRTIYLSPNADTVLGSGADEHLEDPDLWWRSIDPRDHDHLMASWTRAYETEEPYTVDYRYLRPDGRVVWLREHATPVRAESGEVSHWQGVLLDVTAERAATDELAASEARYRSLIEHLPASVYTLTNDDPARVVFASPRVEDLYGYPIERWMDPDDLWPHVIHPDDRASVLEDWNAARRSGRPFDRRYRVRHADGGFRWVVDHVRPVHSPDGEIVAWEGMSFEVTRERETAAALQESEVRHERLLQQIPGIAFSLLPGPTRRFDYLSPRIQDILGYPRSQWFEEEVIWENVIHPDDREAVISEWERCVRDGVPFRKEYRALHMDGHVVWLRAETLPVRGAEGEVERWQGLWLDITETQLAREEQARLEARYQRLVEQAPAIVFTTDTDGAVQYVGPQVEQILGYPRTAWTEDPALWESLLHPDDRDRVLEAWEESSRSERPFDAEYRLRRADETYRWVHETTHPVRDADGTVSSWHGLTVDVHEIHTATEAREAAEARARALLENVPAVLYEMGPDDERHTLYVSPHIERLLGYSRREWLDQPDIWTELLHPDDREVELAAHDRHSSTGEPWSREYRMIAADGRVVWVHDQATLAIDADARPSWQGVLVDVTSRHVTAELLQITNEELERRIFERTAAMEEANELMGLEIAERRRAETELRRAEVRFRQLVEESPGLVYAWQTRPGPQGEFDGYISPQIETMLGYTPDEWHRDWHIWDRRLHPHDRARVLAAAVRSEKTGEPFEDEYRYLAKDGRVVWVFDRATLLERDADGRPFMFQGVMVDITAQKDAERKAAEAEERLQRVAEDAPYVTYALTVEQADPTGVSVEFLSRQIESVIGYPATEWNHDPLRWIEFVHPDDRDRAMAHMTTCWRSGAPWVFEYRMITAEGKVVWLRDRGRCVDRDEEGRPARLVGVLLDVTDEIEERERERDELSVLRRIVDAIPAITWIGSVAADGGDPRYLYISPQVEQLLGYTAEELLAERMHFPRMIHPDDEDRVDRAWRDACLAGAEIWEGRWRARHRDGTYRSIHARARRVSEPDAATLVWVGFSIDETGWAAAETTVAGVDAELA